MGPDETLMGELPFTGQLPCRSMLCRGALSWGALQISAEASWVPSSPDLSASAFAAADPIIPCVEPGSWFQVFVLKFIVSMHPGRLRIQAMVLCAVEVYRHLCRRCDASVLTMKAADGAGSASGSGDD